ncbi:F-box and WD repeat domain-containing 11-A-like [Lepisosteus oculatus]|uniref:F-box and WD repeat domain-containing 11-A-like n=1 Tax=Lepisosteus oculatus TaxID=7918 RepID=UPI0035F51C5A
MEKTQRNLPFQQEAFLEKDYESQLEKILEQIEEYNHPMRCRILEQLLIRSQFSQIQLLWTILQPVCHRDFMYTARMAFPEFQLSPISTEFSRRLSRWFKGGRMGRLFRVPSVFLRDLDDVRRFTSNGQHTQEQTERLGTGPVKEYEEQRIRLPKLCSQEDFLKNRSEPQLDALPCCEDLRLAQRTFMWSQEVNPSHEQMIFLKKGKKVLPRRRVSPKPGQIIEMYEHQWNDAQRNHLLKKLLLLLDLRQHYYILTFLTVKCYRDFIGLLPKKLSLKILSFLSPRELLLTSQVCKTWYKRCGSNRLWQIKCKESTVGIPVIEQAESWKRVFKNDYCLRQNWKRGRCYTVELKGHTAVVCCVAVCDKYVASGSKDKTICVWLLHNGNHVQTLEGHRKGVWGLQFFTENLLVSSSYDSSIKSISAFNEVIEPGAKKA